MSEDKISLIIEEFASSMQGIYQAIFIVGTANVTKTIMEIEGSKFYVLLQFIQVYLFDLP